MLAIAGFIALPGSDLERKNMGQLQVRPQYWLLNPRLIRGIVTILGLIISLLIRWESGLVWESGRGKRVSA